MEKRLIWLAEIIDNLSKYEKTAMAYLAVEFTQTKGKKKHVIAEIDLIAAMDALINDVYFFGDYDLRDAENVRLISR